MPEFSTPVTHSELFRAAYSAGCTQHRQLHVQCKKRGVVQCAQVVELIEHDGKEWVKLRNDLHGVFALPCHLVQLCETRPGWGCVCATSGD